jgi:hypothetical protein
MAKSIGIGQRVEAGGLAASGCLFHPAQALAEPGLATPLIGGNTHLIGGGCLAHLGGTPEKLKRLGGIRFDRAAIAMKHAKQIERFGAVLARSPLQPAKRLRSLASVCVPEVSIWPMRCIANGLPASAACRISESPLMPSLGTPRPAMCNSPRMAVAKGLSSRQRH